MYLFVEGLWNFHPHNLYLSFFIFFTEERGGVLPCDRVKGFIKKNRVKGFIKKIDIIFFNDKLLVNNIRFVTRYVIKYIRSVV